jgi:E3 ubiquitin-protein ligase MYCBP2
VGEAWALQYNKHLGKTLLVPVEEPKSILDEIIKETMAKRLPTRPGGDGGGGGVRRTVNGEWRLVGLIF